MTRMWTDAEEYHPGMEAIDSDIMDTVLSELKGSTLRPIPNPTYTGHSPGIRG